MVHNVVRNLVSVMRSQLLNSRSVRLDGLETFTVLARTRGRGVEHEKDVSPNQVASLHFMFTPEYTRSAALGTTRALWQGVEEEIKARINNHYYQILRADDFVTCCIYLCTASKS